MVKSDGLRLSLSEAVSQAARSAGVTPITAPNALEGDLENPELQEAYSEQVSRVELNQYVFFVCFVIKTFITDNFVLILILNVNY